MKDGNRAESKSNESPCKLDVPDMRKSSWEYPKVCVNLQTDVR